MVKYSYDLAKYKGEMYTRNNYLLLVTYLAETLTNELLHIMLYFLLKICLIMISIIFWCTKNFIMKHSLRLLIVRYSYNLGDFHPDILIEAILIKSVYCTKLVITFLYVTFQAKTSTKIS